MFKVTDEGIDYSGFASKISIEGASIHRVSMDEEGRPDIIAYKYYGDASLWWAICQVNNIYYGYNVQYRFKAYDSDIYMEAPVQNGVSAGQPVIPDNPSHLYKKDIETHNGNIIYNCYRSEVCYNRSVIIPTIEAIKGFVATAV